MTFGLDTTYFGNTVFQYLIFFAIIIGAVIVGRIIYYISKKVLRVRAEKSANKFDDILVEVIEKPLVFLIFIIGLTIALKNLTLSASFEVTAGNTIEILIIMDVFWFIISFIDGLILNFVTPAASKSKSDLDDMLVPLIRKIMKTVLVLIAIIMIVDNFGYDITSLIAGLGIGGLAFALAAKDMLANLFGGVAIMTDKPFKLGDRIKVEGHDGWVREIGLRSTRVETLDGFQMVVPNSIISNSILENVSKEKHRKVKMTIGVEYSTSMKKMEQAKKIIEDVVIKNKKTVDKTIVSFTEFGESSLNFTVIYWIAALDEILNVKNEINMNIKEQFEKAKINMAFPTRTVHIVK
ncbi:MAG: mechanosensitive ion channel family protein [archaeon]